MIKPQELFRIHTRSKKPVYEQIEQSILTAIRSGKLNHGEMLPSVNSVARKFNLSAGTVHRAYKGLVEQAILVSRQGKGYFVGTTEVGHKYNIFLLFDRLNAYKEVLYESFIHSLGESARVDVYFHHYREDVFGRLIRDNIGKYSHYVIMPHFDKDVSELVKPVPADRLLLLDKSLPGIKGEYAAVYQDFENDIYQALKSGLFSLKKYHTIALVKASDPFQYVPEGIRLGLMKFCSEESFSFKELPGVESQDLQEGQVFIIFRDSDLIRAIKELEKNELVMGQNVGLISFDDTPIKSILAGGITVLSTDFKVMGETAARLLKEDKKEKLRNPFHLIMRKTL